jgi:hypothetical protein
MIRLEPSAPEAASLNTLCASRPLFIHLSALSCESLIDSSFNQSLILEKIQNWTSDSFLSLAFSTLSEVVCACCLQLLAFLSCSSFPLVIYGYVFPTAALDPGSRSGLWLALVLCSPHSLWVCGEPEVNSKD